MAQTKIDPTVLLAKEVGRSADALERQNKYRHRFLMGIVFGVGTAIGASIIASLILIGFAKALQVVGLSASTFMDDPSIILEQQIEQQSSQIN